MAATLSQVRAWNTTHLTDAAAAWSRTAVAWEDVFADVQQRMQAPGGKPWLGRAAEAAQRRGYGDRLTVIAAADQLHGASAVARLGATQIDGLKRGVLDAVAAAVDAGFVVGEDFSVRSRDPVPRSQAAARRTQAQVFADDIRLRVAELAAADQRVAAQITAAADGVGVVRFAEDDIGDGRRDGTIQAVDNRTLKQAPKPPDPPPGPMPPVDDADDVRRVLDPLQNGGKRGGNGAGTKPKVKEVWDRPSARQLWDYLTRQSGEGIGPPDYEGAVRALPDGTKIGYRQSTDGWGDTIDVWYPDGTYRRVHTPYAPYFPIIGAPPQLPLGGEPVSLPIPPAQTGHAPVALPPTGIFEPNGLPAWLQNPSTPGMPVSAQPPMIMPGVAVPQVTSPVVSTTGDGLLPDLANDLADVGQKVVGGAAIGVAIAGGLIVSGVTPGGQPVG